MIYIMDWSNYSNDLIFKLILKLNKALLTGVRIHIQTLFLLQDPHPSFTAFPIWLAFYNFQRSFKIRILNRYMYYNTESDCISIYMYYYRKGYCWCCNNKSCNPPLKIQQCTKDGITDIMTQLVQRIATRHHHIKTQILVVTLMFILLVIEDKNVISFIELCFQQNWKI